jgi:aminopeptidase N
VCASNGVQQGEPARDEAAKTVTWRWRTDLPIANYNVALNIAPYVELATTFSCCDGVVMPVRFFVLPESKKRAAACLPQFLDHIRCFEELLGPYPFRREKYGLAETPHLGMEHQTIIAYGNGFRDEQYDWLHNHELAHEWWGNLVTCRDWKDMWIHEGFGTYMQPLYRERRFGRKAYDDEVAKYRPMNRTPIAPRESRNSHEIYFAGGGGNDLYYKGAAILHTLRWQMGDERFFRFLRELCYPTPDAAPRFVDTEDVVRCASAAAGEDLAWFFDVYVRQPRLPRLQQQREGELLRLRWSVPDDLPFALAVPVRVGGDTVRVAMPGGVGELKVGDRDILVDPEGRLLVAKEPRPR